MSRSVMIPGPWPSGSSTTAAPTSRRDISLATARRVWSGPTVSTVGLMPSATCMPSPFAPSWASGSRPLATFDAIYYRPRRPSSRAATLQPSAGPAGGELRRAAPFRARQPLGSRAHGQAAIADLHRGGGHRRNRDRDPHQLRDPLVPGHGL